MIGFCNLLWMRRQNVPLINVIDDGAISRKLISTSLEWYPIVRTNAIIKVLVMIHQLFLLKLGNLNERLGVISIKAEALPMIT